MNMDSPSIGQLRGLIQLFTLVTLMICFGPAREVEAGGKGKVPIYMPIPIPIPMPMGPSGGKYHHHHHQQQQQRDDDHGGEVKKIYLLQPMPKIQPQPHLKGGGFMGAPVQTHIHMTAPVVNGRHIARGHASREPPVHSHQSASYEGDQSEHTPTGGAQTKSAPAKQSGHSHESMKILPIVIIPPIAPIQPIQMPASNSVQGAKMTLTPQFNNYLVTPASTELSGHEKSAFGYSRPAKVTLLQDHKSFSDYGGSGGGSQYRDNYAARSRLRGRHIMRPKQVDYDGHGSRQVRYLGGQDELGDDYDKPVSGSWQRSSGGYSSPSSSWPRSSGTIRRAIQESRSRANSIREILDQQALFDDDLSAFDERREHSINTGRSTGNCCGSSERRSRRFNEAPTADYIFAATNTNADQREAAEMDQQLSEQPLNQRSSSARIRQYDSIAPSLTPLQEDESDKVAHLRRKEPSPVYYERDSDLLPSRSASLRHSSQNDDPTSGKRLYLDERELLDDYEWRFDSIKSVAHISPQSTASNKTEIGPMNTNTTRPVPVSLGIRFQLPGIGSKST